MKPSCQRPANQAFSQIPLAGGTGGPGPKRLEEWGLLPSLKHECQNDKVWNLSSGPLAESLWTVFFCRKWEDRTFVVVVWRLSYENRLAPCHRAPERGVPIAGR